MLFQFKIITIKEEAVVLVYDPLKEYVMFFVKGYFRYNHVLYWTYCYSVLHGTSMKAL